MYKIEMLDMRKVRNWILLSLALLLSCNRDAVYTVSIQGELEGIKYGTAYLRTFGERDSFLLSSAIEKGRFVLEGVLPEKGRYTLQINRKVLYLFLDGEKMQLKGDYKQLNNSDVKGSLANELEQEFYLLLEENYQKEFQKLQAIYREIIQQEDQHAADDVMSQMLQLDEKRYVLVRDFIKTHPDNIFSIFLANTEIKGSYEKGKELYALLSPSMQQTAQGREVKQQVDELAISALSGNSGRDGARGISCNRFFERKFCRAGFLGLLVWTLSARDEESKNIVQRVCCKGSPFREYIV